MALNRPRQNELFGALLVGFVLFNIVFPKGGFKIGEIPITNGYIFLGVMFGIGILYAVATLRIGLAESAILGLSLPFQIWILFTIYYFGFEDVSYGIAQVIVFCVLPYLILIGGSFFLRYGDTEKLKSALVYGLRFVAVFGIFQFFYYYVFRSFIEIPVLIVNIADLGQLDGKHNMRGEFSKLISTYNNGNIYGVCMCMLAPLYIWLDKAKQWRAVFILALFLTLSRTAWIGMIIILIHEFMGMKWGWKKLTSAILGISVVLLIPIFAPQWFGLSEDFLADSELGGRASYLEEASEIGMLPSRPLGAIKEVVYFSIAYVNGISGLLLFLTFILAPIAVLVVRGEARRPAGRRIIFGLSLYVLLCASDGAILFPPTMTIFYFLAACGLTRAFERSPYPSPALRRRQVESAARRRPSVAPQFGIVSEALMARRGVGEEATAGGRFTGPDRT